ncbi:MAG: type IV pilus twitching motility protein PilT [bacterium]|nr:type IV pilus twitching motility protein PilT [bacterium]MDT8365619.1 type IV pilus twitching motility protein PilT [bacterium]
MDEPTTNGTEAIDDSQKSPGIHQLLKFMVDNGASDLHITPGTPPQLRIDGALRPLNVPTLTPPETKKIAYSLLTDAQKHIFEEEKELDFSFGVKGLSRFRANVFQTRGSVGAAIRTIPFEILTFESLKLPKVVADLNKRPKGLILVTGPTGSGKSTTLAAMIDSINRTRHEHIITIEDPIEFLHPHKSCVVNQREVGADTSTFKRALKSILRQDPDIVLIGEMRDLETIEAALSVAETGHLVFGTLHTNNCVQTINRILDVFPPYQQPQIRAQLSFVLEGVLSQTLIPKKGGGRCLALEIMVPNAAIRNLIREDKVHQIYSSMQVGQSKYGMQTMNQSLLDLHLKGTIPIEEVLGRTTNLEEMRQMLTQAGINIV